jgi:hypothetical protein
MSLWVTTARFARGAVNRLKSMSMPQTEKLLRQPSYYSRWFYCINPNCKMERIMPRHYLVWNGSPPSPWDV